jgi:hypothetical protein
MRRAHQRAARHRRRDRGRGRPGGSRGDVSLTTIVHVHALSFNPDMQTLLSGYEGTTTSQISY